MAFKIYTKTGDKGSTSLLGGTKVSKGQLRIEAYGSVDELNSYIGLCHAYLQDEDNKKILRITQDRLFTVGSILACDPEKNIKTQIPELHESDCVLLEKEIDRMTEVLSPMRSFILPGGSIAISHIHIARCICRRAERCCVRLEETSAVPPIIIKYLNRLSDYLFVLARYTGHLTGVNDVPWVPVT